MPIYEYVPRDQARACEHCSGAFEVRQTMSDPPLRVCPKCGAPVKRAISAVGISTHRPSRSLLSDKSLKEKGFKKLVNEGDGKFRSVL